MGRLTSPKSTPVFVKFYWGTATRSFTYCLLSYDGRAENLQQKMHDPPSLHYLLPGPPEQHSPAWRSSHGTKDIRHFFLSHAALSCHRPAGTLAPAGPSGLCDCPALKPPEARYPSTLDGCPHLLYFSTSAVHGGRLETQHTGQGPSRKQMATQIRII